MSNLVPATAPTVRPSLVPTTFAEAFDFAKCLANSSMVPADYRGKPENIVLAIQWGAELGLPPLQAIQNIAVINGKPSVYGDALVAMVKGSPVCDDVVERFEGDGDGLTAICEAKRKGKMPVIARFSVADAKRAGLWGKAGPWTQYPRRMLQMRARGFALRDAFPDVLRGVITREEADDYPVDVSQPTRAASVIRPGPVTDAVVADLDLFATEPDGMTDAAMLADMARQEARKGCEQFRAWWKTLGHGEREVIRPLLGECQGIAEAADHAAEDDPFGPSASSGLPAEASA
jgi:hypothetical protein